MSIFKFYDHGNQDFVKDENGQVFMVEAENWTQADDIFLQNESRLDWTNSGLDTIEITGAGVLR